MKMRNKTPLLIAALSASLLSASVHAREIDDKMRQVGHARWQKETNVQAQHWLDKAIPNETVNVFFIREQDADSIQTSANIAINDRFQVSLQPGNYSQVFSCSGVNRLSADITGHKHNDLLRNAVNYDLAEKQAYFFSVDVNEAGAASIRHLTREEALPLLEKKPQQVHQITRVVPNCEKLPEKPKVEKVQIELKVLFDTDKHFVKKHYYPEIEQAVDYMKRFPDTKVVLEGHTDSRMPDAYNDALSQRRVNAVRDIMVKHYGIAAERIQAVGYGESRPVAPNDTAENMQLNRRVIAVFDVATPQQ